MAPGDYPGGPGDSRDPAYLPPPGDAPNRQDYDSTVAAPSPSWHNGNYPTYPPARPVQSPALSMGDRDRDGDSRRGAERNQSRPPNNGGGIGVGRNGSGMMRTCKKCGEQLTGQFVRALGGTFHLHCFKCRVSPFASPGAYLLSASNVSFQ